jgi:PAS domain S-box-containing protein
MSRPRNPKTARPVDSRKDSLQRAQLFRVVAETATDAIISIDDQSIILFVNKAAERIFGYAVSEMMGREATMLMPDYLRETHRKAVGRYLQTGKKHFPWAAVKLTGLHRSGKEFPIEVS